MDNGPEFTGPVRLVGTDGVGPRFIQPGKPIQNAFVGTVHSAISRRNGSRAGSARPDSMKVRAPRPALAPASGPWLPRQWLTFVVDLTSGEAHGGPRIQK